MAVVSPIERHLLVFLGDQSVGKTSILTRYMYDRFKTTYMATIGNDFVIKRMDLKDRKVSLQIWDTAGQEKFRSLLPSHMRVSTVAIIVYDITNRQSFLSTPKWIEEVRKERGSDATIVLVGNKSDIVDNRQVTTNEGFRKAIKFGVMFVETSANDGYNIQPLFQLIVAALPGMETVSSRKQEDIVEVNLRSTSI